MTMITIHFKTNHGRRYPLYFLPDQSALFENIMTGEYHYEDAYWRDISPLAKAFIDSLLVRPANERSTATQALSHPWFRAMLDQDLVAPVSPADSVNLLPAVRKNFDARNVFKKAVRAVGILRRMQGGGGGGQNGPSQPVGSSAVEETSENNESATTGSPSGCRVLKFHDVVSAAIFSKRGVYVTNEVAPEDSGCSDDRNLEQAH